MEAREYKPEDSVSVKNLILSVLKKEYPFDPSAYQDSDINDVTGTYSGEGNGFFVVEEKGEVAGVIGVKKDGIDSALVRRFFVKEGQRNKGFGTILLSRAIAFCKSGNYGKLVFRATDRMSKAVNILKKLGFTETEDLEVSGFHIHTFVLQLKDQDR